jgi:uncharacterized membrane protein YbaN (DUF454 family)
MNADLDFEGSRTTLASGRSASFSEVEGFLDVSDRSLFRPGFEGFCRRLAESAVGLGGVRSAFVCLASGTCRLAFDGGRFSPSEMAEWFAEAVRTAVQPRAEAEVPEPSGWVSLLVFSRDEGGATWESTLEDRGRFRLRHQGLIGHRKLAHQVANELAQTPGVDSCRVAFWADELVVRFDRKGVCSSEALAIADRSCRRVLASSPPDHPPDAVPQVATGLQRLGYLALAGGSFGLTVVGLIIPGVPTVPFLLATSYFLVRSSPKLNDRLLQSRFFGPIVTDLEFGHGLQRINRIKLIGLSLTIPVVTVLLIAPTWPILVVMLVVTSAGLVAITQIPAIESEPSPSGSKSLATALAF